MFGVIVSGRPVNAAPQVISETQYAFRIAPEPRFSHFVVFILPGIQLPPGTAATVYVQVPPAQDFTLLGGIGPGKESAIFKINGIGPLGPDPSSDEAMMTDGGPAAGAGGDVGVGVSIEPAAQVEAQLASLKGAPAQQPQSPQTSTAMIRKNSASGGRTTTKLLAQRIIGNAFNFLASFGSDTVPLKAFQDWWIKFEKKVDLDPSFLEREGQG